MPEPTRIPLHQPPRHDWRGLTFIGAVYLGSLGAAVAAIWLFVAVTALFDPFSATLVSVPVLIVAAVGFVLAGAVRQFDAWAYEASTLLLAIAIVASATAAYVVVDPNNLAWSLLAAAGFVALLLMNAFWLHYLWSRRSDFAPLDPLTLSRWRRRITGRPGQPAQAAAVPQRVEDAT